MKKHQLLILLLLIVASACRKADEPTPSITKTIFAPQPSAQIKGLYVLNEGNMNSNKASLDRVNYTAGTYQLNIYNEINPAITKGLGDVGNDVGVYGSKLYVVVNNSNKVEVLDAHTAKRLGQVDIINCRSVTFYNGKAYVSAYLGTVGDPNAPNGIVAEIDTATLGITRKVTVGRQPEELAVVGGKLYVANSGGYSPPNYERTVSVIDLASFTEAKRIDVAINLDKLKVDPYGDIYVTSRGDYYNVPPDLFLIDTKTDQVKKDFHLPVNNLWIDGDVAYVYSYAFSYITGNNTIAYNKINIKDETILDTPFITDGTEKSIKVPYGIIVNPETKEILVSDAKDYVTPGTLYCFGPDGKKRWSATTGDIPGHFAFIK